MFFIESHQNNICVIIEKDGINVFILSFKKCQNPTDNTHGIHIYVSSIHRKFFSGPLSFNYRLKNNLHSNFYYQDLQQSFCSRAHEHINKYTAYLISLYNLLNTQIIVNVKNNAFLKKCYKNSISCITLHPNFKAIENNHILKCKK